MADNQILKSLLPASYEFLTRNDAIYVYPDRLDPLALALIRAPTHEPLAEFNNMPPLFFLIVDALNFCFWNPDPRKTFRYRNLSGSIAFATLVKKAFHDKPNIFAPERLASQTMSIFSHIISPAKGELQISDERIAVLHEIALFLARHNIDDVVRAYRGKPVDEAASFFLSELPYTFTDICTIHGISLLFLKKLRLFLSDLDAFCNTTFSNSNHLLVYADYRIPQVFIHYGVLKVSMDLNSALERNAPLEYGSEKEIALRAGSVVASAHLADKLGINFPELDYRLWIHSKEIKPIANHHRTISRWY